MRHELEIEEVFADAIMGGDKNFEIRNNDRGFQKGDIIKFIPLDCLHIELPAHPINKKLYQITYVLSGWGLKEGFCVFGFKEVEE